MFYSESQRVKNPRLKPVDVEPEEIQKTKLQDLVYKFRDLIRCQNLTPLVQTNLFDEETKYALAVTRLGLIGKREAKGTGRARRKQWS